MLIIIKGVKQIIFHSTNSIYRGILFYYMYKYKVETKPAAATYKSWVSYLNTQFLPS